MFCPRCGVRNDDNAFRCTACQAVIQPAQVSAIDDKTMRMILPIGRSGWAIAAGYAGLFAFLIVPAPLALILGVIAIRHLKNHPDKHGMGRAVFGTVVGVAGTMMLIYLLLA